MVRVATQDESGIGDHCRMARVFEKAREQRCHVLFDPAMAMAWWWDHTHLPVDEFHAAPSRVFREAGKRFSGEAGPNRCHVTRVALYSRGRPRPRVAMTVRWISLVPPSMVLATLRRYW